MTDTSTVAAPIQEQPAGQGVSAGQAMLAMSQKKSMGIGLILSFLFGPLGLLYATVSGGLIMLALTLVIGLLTLGLGFVLGWIGSMIWAAVAINKHNSKLIAGLQG